MTRCCGSTEAGVTKHGAMAPALGILAERFARGEIDKAEFDDKRQILAGLQEESSPAARNCCC
jgi:uncharacterized membrane protein